MKLISSRYHWAVFSAPILNETLRLPFGSSASNRQHWICFGIWSATAVRPRRNPNDYMYGSDILVGIAESGYSDAASPFSIGFKRAASLPSWRKRTEPSSKLSAAMPTQIASAFFFWSTVRLYWRLPVKAVGRFSESLLHSWKNIRVCIILFACFVWRRDRPVRAHSFPMQVTTIGGSSPIPLPSFGALTRSRLLPVWSSFARVSFRFGQASSSS